MSVLSRLVAVGIDYSSNADKLHTVVLHRRYCAKEKYRSQTKDVFNYERFHPDSKNTKTISAEESASSNNDESLSLTLFPLLLL